MERLNWHAVDAEGSDLATGRPPQPPGASSPAAALAAVPVPAWPVAVIGSDGRRLSLAQSLGQGGVRVEQMLSELLSARSELPDARLARLAAATPAGCVDLPLALVPLGAGLEAAAAVDRSWLKAVAGRREAPRRLLVDATRETDLEAALNVAMLVATEGLDPPDGDVAAHIASGARLWLLGGAVAWALTDADQDPFAAWAELLTYGLWPVGPSRGRLVVCAATR